MSRSLSQQLQEILFVANESVANNSSEEINEKLKSSAIANNKQIIRGAKFSPSLRRYVVIVPNGFDAAKTATLVSSRIGRSYENHPDWFEHLNIAVRSAKRDGDLLLSFPRTTCDRFLAVAAHRSQAPLLRIEIATRNNLETCLNQFCSSYVKSSILVVPIYPGIGSDLDCDQILMALAQRIYVLHVNDRGKSFDRLDAEMSASQKTVFVATSQNLVPKPLQDSLYKSGATGWYLSTKEFECNQRRKLAHSITGIYSLPEWTPGVDYLYHCTRRRTGPWPDQEEESFINELLTGQAKDRSPLSSLIRILRQQRILANASFNRSGESVVSFTSCQLASIKDMKVFRPHLSRWDFEPYGVGIASKYLESAGAKPVIYGDSQCFESLADSEKPYFQKKTTTSSKGNVTDWSLEKEWRVVGDVELSHFSQPIDNLHLLVTFVPTLADAFTLRTTTDLPIVVLNE